MFSQFFVQIFALYNFFCKNLRKKKAQIFYGSYMVIIEDDWRDFTESMT